MAIDVEEVGRVIARPPWRLAFPAELESGFEADTADERCRRVIQHNYLGIAIYNAFLLGDFYLVPDVFRASLCLHLLVMTPIMGLVIAAIARRPPAWQRESILAGGIVLGTVAILGLMLASHSPLHSSEHISVVLVILFATMVQRIRFPYVLVACVVSLVLYVAALSAVAHHNPARMAVADAVFAGVVLFSLVGSYNLEYEQRMGYLLSLRDRLRNEELERISRRDPLTGLGNRRALDFALARRHARGVGRDKPTSILLFDIDFFKAFNDANGHLAGDECLKRVAALIGSDPGLARDCVFRFGGEEFLALLDDSAPAEAFEVAERIRRAVETAAIRFGAARDGVMTVSVGMASGSMNDEASLAALIDDADRALYGAKRNGRNRVTHLDGSSSETHPPSTIAA